MENLLIVSIEEYKTEKKIEKTHKIFDGSESVF
jgi:hypothetical protein